MSRGKRARAPARAARARRSRARFLWLIVAIAAAAFAAWKLRPAQAPRPENPLSSLDPLAAYREALADVKTGRLRESVPYFHRAQQGVATDFPEIHYNYGVTLAALSMQYRLRAGRPSPATRSSVERVALVREALGEFDRAAALAHDRNAAIGVRRYRATIWTSWGFPWEAATAFQDAKNVDSTDAWTNRQYARYLAAMRNPGGARFTAESLAAAPGTP